MLNGARNPGARRAFGGELGLGERHQSGFEIEMFAHGDDSGSGGSHSLRPAVALR